LKLKTIYLVIPAAIVAVVAVIAVEATINSGPAPGASTVKTDARTIKEIMDSTVDPTADYLFESVRIVSDEHGVTEEAPKTDADWATVRDHLNTLDGAVDLLSTEGRKAAPPGARSLSPLVENEPEVVQQLLNTNHGDFVKHAKRLRDAVRKGLKAVDGKDANALRDSLTDVDKACEACHLQFFYPNDPRAQKAARDDGI
jgi:hypothetical protein